ncbi:MAG: hypothetical protein RLZZ292_4002, partial [Bacteroidota bacterium]
MDYVFKIPKSTSPKIVVRPLLQLAHFFLLLVLELFVFFIVLRDRLLNDLYYNALNAFDARMAGCDRPRFERR